MPQKVTGFTAGITPVGTSISAPVLNSATSIVSGGGKGIGFDPVSLGLSLGSKLIGTETINKTIGQVFANGFNLKCWGSSRTPAKSKSALPAQLQDIGAYAQTALSSTTASDFEMAVNDFYKWFYTYDPKSRVWLKTTAKDCTKAGLEITVNGYDAFKRDQVTPTFKAFAEQNGWKWKSLSSVAHQVTAMDGRVITVSLERVQISGGSVLDAFTGKGKTSSAGGTMLLVGALALFFGRKFIKK